MWLALQRRLRVVFVCFVLESGALAGVPMRPEEIRELMHGMNVPKIAHVLPEDDAGGNPPS